MFEIDPFELSLASPLRSASETIEVRRGFILRYGSGLGEATPLTPWTESYDEATEVLSTIDESDRSIGSLLADLESTPAARHGVSLAVTDHLARRRGQPLYRFLGGSTRRDRIPVNATLDADDLDELRWAGLEVTSGGYQAVKLKVGGSSPAHDLERIATLREAIGSDVDLRLDANGAWSRDEALALVEDLTEFDLDYVEQPTEGIDDDVCQVFADHDVPIAVDEALRTEGITAVLRSDIDAVVIKPMAVGGIDTARAIAMAARGCGITPVISNLVTGSIARTGAAHVAASLPAVVPAGLDTGQRFDGDLTQTVPTVVDGHLELPDGDGLGLSEVRRP